MVEECAASQRQLEVLCEPCGDRIVAGALAPLVIVFGKGPEAESPAFWRVYNEALSDLPRMALDRAVNEWSREGKFFPKPAEIRERADVHASAMRMAAWRAKEAQKAPAPQGERVTDPAVKAQFNALMSDLAKKLDGKDMLGRTVSKEVRRGVQAKVDETGISPEARALLERQAKANDPHLFKGEAAA